MTSQPDIDAMDIEGLVDLKERVEKKLNEKIAAEKSDLEKRQAALARLEGRVAGRKQPTMRAPRSRSDGSNKTPTEKTKDGAAQTDAGQAAPAATAPASSAAASA
jgi:uncharacterized coiled-coil protein SlyX